MRAWPLFAIPALMILGLGWSGAAAQSDEQPAAAAPPARPAAAEPMDMVMYWHDRAFGQSRLAIARKDGDKLRQYAWLLAQVAGVNGKGRPDDAAYGELAGEVERSARELLTVGDDWSKAMQLATGINERCQKCHDRYDYDASEGG